VENKLVDMFTGQMPCMLLKLVSSLRAVSYSY